MSRKNPQQVELIRRQAVFDSIDAKAACIALDFEPTEAQPATRNMQGGPPAQDSAQTCEQFARTERLGQVIVRAEFEADDAVCLLASSGKHQDRDIRLGHLASADSPGGLETVDVR